MIYFTVKWSKVTVIQGRKNLAIKCIVTDGTAAYHHDLRLASDNVCTIDMSLCHTSLQCSMTCAVLDYRAEQGNRRLHFARDVHSPSPPIGDEAYRQRAGGEPNHGHSSGVARNVFGGYKFLLHNTAVLDDVIGCN